MAQSMQESLAPDWEVELPLRRQASFNTKKPRATLVIHTEGAGEERRQLPLAVGKLLASKKKADELHPGSRAELLYMVGELAKSCASARVERLVNRRDYSSTEIRQKLQMDGYAPSVVDACVERACEIGLVSDRRYADVFIRSKIAAGWGMARIERELSRRGIDVQEVAGWPYEYLDPEDEFLRALEVAGRKSVRGDRAHQKLVRFLCSRGFSLGVAIRAAHEALSSQEPDELVGF